MLIDESEAIVTTFTLAFVTQLRKNVTNLHLSVKVWTQIWREESRRQNADPFCRFLKGN
jgi:hypothetical protein